MRLIVLTILLFTFSCTSDSSTVSSNSEAISLDNIQVSSAEIEEVRKTEEESQHMLQHIKNTELSNKSLNQEAFDKIDDMINYTIQLGKAGVKINDMHAYKDEFSKKYEALRQYADNNNSESGAFMVEYIDPINPLIDMTFDSQNMEDFKINLQELKVYLGDFHKLFSKHDSED